MAPDLNEEVSPLNGRDPFDVVQEIGPGPFLREALREQEVTQVSFARAAGLSAKHVNQVIKGKVRISPDFALRLEEALSGFPPDPIAPSAEWWLALQAKYDLTQLRANTMTLAERLRADPAVKFWKDEVLPGLRSPAPSGCR